MAPAAVEDGIPEQKNEEGNPEARVFHHSLVTENPDALKFAAAASLQLQSGHKHETLGTTDSRLIISPYNDDLHLLDLTTLDTPVRLLAKALTALKPIRSDYATAEYRESFNWGSVLEVLRELAAAEGYEWEETSFYVVMFCSRLLPAAHQSDLYDLDIHSLGEATASGGLLKYWFGTKDAKLQNLATCMYGPVVCGA